LCWLAPETLKENTFTKATDIWSYGITLWEMFSFAKTPYAEFVFMRLNSILSILQEGQRLSKPLMANDQL